MLYLEVGPLSEHEYTGIPQVTAAIAEEMLGDTRNDVGFFMGRQVLDRGLVEGLLKLRSGRLLYSYLGKAQTPMAPERDGQPSVAIFPNVKTTRKAFDYEAQIVHDLSSLLTPQFHTKDTIDFHALSLRDDLLTNDLTVCVSEATKNDVIRYLALPKPESVVAIPLGHAWQEALEYGHAAALHKPEFINSLVEPFVLILGTIEPRKNIGVVLDFLGRSPSILNSHRFVFVGRRGWGDQFETYLERHGVSAAYESKRIIFTGFVSEQTKYSLMKEAKLVVYPSLFEGFGLPVLEAMTLGAPVLTTRSSSLPEVGGDACYYFDPFADGGFATGFKAAMRDLEQNEESVRERARARGLQFSWPKFYKKLCTALAEATDGAVKS